MFPSPTQVEAGSQIHRAAQRFLEVAVKGLWAHTHALCNSSRFGILTLSPWQLVQWWQICRYNKYVMCKRPRSLYSGKWCFILSRMLMKQPSCEPLRAQRAQFGAAASWNRFVWVLYLRSAGSDCKSAKYFTRLCKSRNVYLQGYLQHTAHSAEDESSTGYIQYVRGGLWMSSWRRMWRGREHCWAITAVLIFCHIVSQQETLSGKGNCKSHPSPPAITAAQGSASEASVLTGRAQVFAVFSQNLFAGKKKK